MKKKDIHNSDKNDEFVGGLIKLDRLVDRMVPNLEDLINRTDDVIKLIIIGNFMTIRGMYRAITLLLKKGMATEYENLVRSLITASLRLMYLHKHTKNRDALVCGWRNNWHKEWESVTKEALSSDSESDPSSMNSEIEKHRIELRKYASKKGIGRYCEFPSEKDMAKDLDKTYAYLNYKLLSQSVHISSPLLNRKRTEEQICAVTVEAMEWFLEAAVSVGKIYGWDIKELDSLGHDGIVIFENLKKSS